MDIAIMVIINDRRQEFLLLYGFHGIIISIHVHKSLGNY